MDSSGLDVERSFPLQQDAACEGSMDHVLEVLASHSHPLILVGPSADRWMGSHVCTTIACDLLVRNSALESVASDLVETGHWEFYHPDPQVHEWAFEKRHTDLELRRTDPKHDSEYRYLHLYSETTYHISVDDCPLVEVPDIYSWHAILVEEKWHPATDREDGWWFGPQLQPDTKIPNLPEEATHVIFSKGLPRGKSPSNNHPVFVPSLPAYLDALIYQATQYKHSKEGRALIASWQIRALTRYLYLELPRQQLPLLIELEEYKFMENYLQNFVRKPRFVYRCAPGSESGLESTRVNDWDPTSFPDWCGTMKPSETTRGQQQSRDARLAKIFE